MQKLITLTALFIAGRWLQPGAEVPLSVAGFDYAKAFRKGMLEAEDGSEVLNPEPETAVPAASTPAEPSSDEATLRTQAAQLTRERDTARQKATDLKKLLDKATDALKPFEGLDGAALKDQLAALTEYRDTLGELLPTSFPGRAKLFTAGYYTLPMLEGVEKATLIEIDGIAETTADQILAALPAPAQD